MTSEQQPNPKQRLRPRLIAAVAAGALAMVGLGAFGLWAYPGGNSEPAVAQHVLAAFDAKAPPPRMVEAGAPFSFADLVERVSPAVVTVTVEEKVDPSQNFDLNDLPEPFRKFFGPFGQGQSPQAPRHAVAMGSGFIIDKKGYIVTNNHVVAGATKITVKLPDGREFKAHLVGTDPATDIALLKVDSKTPLPTVEFADDRQVRVGDWVIAVGNPFGLSNTVTAGIVSSIGRDIGNGPYTDFIQIDAPINRGNSGGPTFDTEGKVIGMNSMIFSPSGGSVGIGFAIPASTIHDVVAQLKAHGKVSRGYLGVEIQDVTPEIAASLGNKNLKGALVASVVPDGPAAQAGFQQGDLIVALNGKAVDDSRVLTRRVAALQAGTDATFSVIRNGGAKTFTAKIGQRKEDQVASIENGGQPSADQTTGSAMGMGLAAVTPQIRQAYNLDQDTDGVVITKVDPDSDAADKGLEPGDVVVSVANRPVHTPQDVKKQIADAKAAGRTSVLLLVSGQDGQQFVAVKIGQT